MGLLIRSCVGRGTGRIGKRRRRRHVGGCGICRIGLMILLSSRWVLRLVMGKIPR